MKTNLHYIFIAVLALSGYSFQSAHSSPINRDLTLIATEVSGAGAQAIFESADGDSVECGEGCVIGQQITVTKISHAGITIQNLSDELFIPVGNNIMQGGIKGDMLAVPAFEMVTSFDNSSSMGAIEVNAFAPLPEAF